VIGVDLIGQIRRAFFEQRRAIRRYRGSYEIGARRCGKVVRSDRTAFKYARRFSRRRSWASGWVADGDRGAEASYRSGSGGRRSGCFEELPRSRL